MFQDSKKDYISSFTVPVIHDYSCTLPNLTEPESIPLVSSSLAALWRNRNVSPQIRFSLDNRSKDPMDNISLSLSTRKYYFADLITQTNCEIFPALGTSKSKFTTTNLLKVIDHRYLIGQQWSVVDAKYHNLDTRIGNDRFTLQFYNSLAKVTLNGPSDVNTISLGIQAIPKWLSFSILSSSHQSQHLGKKDFQFYDQVGFNLTPQTEHCKNSLKYLHKTQLFAAGNHMDKRWQTGIVMAHPELGCKLYAGAKGQSTFMNSLTCGVEKQVFFKDNNHNNNMSVVAQLDIEEKSKFFRLQTSWQWKAPYTNTPLGRFNMSVKTNGSSLSYGLGVEF